MVMVLPVLLILAVVVAEEDSRAGLVDRAVQVS
jgi:hypothetical protein